MTDLVVLVPSRGRPQAAKELAEAFAETCTGDTGLVFAIDSDDDIDAYRDPLLPDSRISICIGENTSMVEALNNTAASQVDFPPDDPLFALGFMGDDHRPRTRGWDEQYVDALRTLGTGLVYGNDLLQRERLPTQVAMTTDIVRALGYMAPPGLGHMYVDNAWLALGQALGRITYLPDVIVEHMHPLVGKAGWDAGHLRVNQPAVFQRDSLAFERWVTDELPDAVERVKAVAR